MRAAVILLAILLAGCAAPAATTTPPRVIEGATVIVDNQGKTPIDAEIQWSFANGTVIRRETASLLGGQRVERDFMPPTAEGPFDVTIALRDKTNPDPTGIMTPLTSHWDPAQCARWQVTYVYDNSISPVRYDFGDTCQR